jgi:hypothetical protein
MNKENRNRNRNKNKKKNITNKINIIYNKINKEKRKK